MSNPEPGYTYAGSSAASASFSYVKTGGALQLATDGVSYQVLKVDSNGALKTTISGSQISLSVTDIEIGAVELKNAASDDRAKIAVASGILVTDIGLAVADPVVSASLSTIGTTLTTANTTSTSVSASLSTIGTTLTTANTTSTAISASLSSLKTNIWDGTSTLKIATSGSATVGTGVQILGTDGVNARIISTNNSGSVNIIQGVLSDPLNGSTINLAGTTGSFSGSSASTLGIAGIQVSLKTDKNCNVYVDQSPDGNNWDIVDTYEYLYTFGGDSWTTQAVNSYYRVRVLNTSSTATTYFRLQTALCPIVEALPRSLDHHGHLKTATTITDHETEKEVQVGQLRDLKVSESTRLIGTGFGGTTKDTNFWSESISLSAAVSQSGEIILYTGTTANATSKYVSTRYARHIACSSNQFSAVALFNTVATVDNIRRIGVYDTNNGLFFELSGSLFGVGSRYATTNTVVYSGAFNGNYGSDYSIDTNLHKFDIEYTQNKNQFYVDDVLIHTITPGANPSTQTLTLPVTFENNNYNSQATNIQFKIRSATISRLGRLETNPIYKYISTAATTVCKYNAGRLHRIVVNNPTNNPISIYDNTAVSGSVIAIIDPDASATPFTLEYNCPFFTGLTVVTAGTPDITVIYE